MNKNTNLIALFVLFFFFFTGCQNPPAQDIQPAKQQLPGIYREAIEPNVPEYTSSMPEVEEIVSGYDVSRTNAISIRTPDPNQVKGWILGCSGVLWERNRDGFDSLGTWKNTEHRVREFKESLSEGWGIQGREDLLDCLYGLTQGGGHNEDFLRQGRLVSKLSEAQLEAFLNQYQSYPEQYNQLRIARQYYGTFGGRGILAWETTRYMFLCRIGYICGWLDEKTAWELMIPVARSVQANFSSWEEMGRNYLVGRQFWSLEETQKEGHLLEDAIDRLTEMPSSPWNRYPWDLDLGGAYELILDPLSGTPDTLKSDVPQPFRVKSSSFEERVPDLSVPELPEPDLSKRNTLDELKKEGPVLVVPDDYVSIQAAVNQANEGDTIFIKAGIYDERVEVDGKNRLRIIGQSARDVVLGVSDPNGIEVITIKKCRDIVLSDITVCDTRTKFEENKSCIGVFEGQADIIRCRIENQQGNGMYWYSNAHGRVLETVIESCRGGAVLICNKGTDVTIDGCLFRENQEQGVHIFQEATARVQNTLLTNNSNGAYISQQGAEATFRHCVIRGSINDGMCVYNKARAHVEDTVFVSNKYSGMRVIDPQSRLTCVRSKSIFNKYGAYFLTSADIRLEECSFAWNTSYGILVSDPSTSVKIDETWCYHNGSHGITVNQAASVEISGCTCSENNQGGITVGSGSTGTIRDCVVSDNSISGIIIRDKDTTADVAENWCFKNGKSGIRVSDGASADVTGNVCESNVNNGIDVYRNQAGGVLKNNHCINNKCHGIYIGEQNSRTVVENNTCSGNGFDGINISNGMSVYMKDNICGHNQHNGISVFKSSESTISENNRCHNNQWNGICVGIKSTDIGVKGNICMQNGNNGILFCEDAHGVIQFCQISENYNTGIYIGSKGTKVDVVNNECWSNYYNGIVITDDVEEAVKVTGNQCYDNYPSGIFIDNAAAVLTENVCRDNPWAGITVKGERAKPEITQNELINNGTWGIRMWNGAEPDIRDNVIEENGKGSVFGVHPDTKPLLQMINESLN